ncbi:hypothetical protein J6590_032651 [Homalodisca vitripennis]|nr:hypothetical protein J6590_032651 [Homalodisca vitripennis]
MNVDVSIFQCDHRIYFIRQSTNYSTCEKDARGFAQVTGSGADAGEGRGGRCPARQLCDGGQKPVARRFANICGNNNDRTSRTIAIGITSAVLMRNS